MAENNAGPLGGENNSGGPPVDLGTSQPAPGQTPPPPPAAAGSPPPPSLPSNAPPPKPAAPPPAAEKQPAKTVADPPPEPEPRQTVPADWPDDWRQKLAGDNKKLLARMERMGSPNDVLNAWLAIEQRMSSGELRRALPKNHTDEELAEYRKSNAIPDKPEDYDVNLGNGFVWGDADKPLLESYTKAAHAANMPPDMLKANLAWFAQVQQQIEDDVVQRDENERVTGSDALRTEWGTEYKKNLTAAKNLFEGAGNDMWNTVMGARAEDGTRLGNKPEFLKFISGISRELNPFATLVPDEAGGAPMKSAEVRMGELNAMMGDKSGPYWRGPQAAALQQEWRDLYEAVQKHKGRAA